MSLLQFSTVLLEVQLPLRPLISIILENIIISRLDELFELFKIKAYCPFRITRDSDLDIDEDTDDLLSEIEKSIKKRRRGKPIRLEISDKCDKGTDDIYGGIFGDISHLSRI